MQPPNTAAARRAAVAALVLAMLAACSDDRATGPDVTPTTADVAFCSRTDPVWVAFQDGDGPWTRAQPDAASFFATYRHTFTTNRAAIATATELPDGLTALSVRYAAPSELAAFGDASPAVCSSGDVSTMLGTVAGLETNEVALVSAGNDSRVAAFPGAGNEFVLRGLPTGPQDVLATRLTLVGNEATMTGIILRRDVQLADGATLPVLDFSSPEAFQPAVRNVTLAGLGSEAAISLTAFRTANSSHGLALLNGFETAATRPYDAIPAERLAPADLQVLTASTAAIDNVARAAVVYFRTPVDRTLAFGAVPLAPQLSVAASAPSLRPRARFSAQADYDRLTSINYQQGQSTLVSVSMTSAYAAIGAAGYDLVVPELADVEGFDPRWALHAGAPVAWTSALIGGTLGLGVNPTPFDGATRRTASDAGVLTP
jgi:hypothetical protein